MTRPTYCQRAALGHINPDVPILRRDVIVPGKARKMMRETIFVRDFRMTLFDIMILLSLTIFARLSRLDK